ncbi:hypothetical protein NC661_08180 [Aquibacillus koreensis]|uniref:Spore coat protein YutH n=1 Tax=Aquibacillus koreensis TaxID=279446 RepID=A0A9X4AJE9_9BACI|nr:hypothetical protein [Aquibacillus koreensis]MCT2535884.1 hypothetical protein [Aquibacillus koreensis]MDC3420340.1 hypothetical protein [Aquibacillus koreensis]
MMELLSNYIPQFQGQKVTVNGYEGYKNGNDFYIIIPNPNNALLHQEQKLVSTYLIANGFENIASPIFNQQNNIITHLHEKEYVVCKGNIKKYSSQMSHPQLLASFHDTGTRYPYAPNYISSYGQWKTLWENKLDTFEQLYQQKMQERPVSHFQRLFLDSFPYLIGLSENAIQYLQETETDQRFHEGDQASITFQRYTNQVQKDLIWSHELTYDHPTRDICEHIRPLMSSDEGHSITRIKTFLNEYEQVRPLSIFGWRLLYSRLLFPIHLFDYLEVGLSTGNDEQIYESFEKALINQRNYQEKLSYFFEEMGIHPRQKAIPEIQWLKQTYKSKVKTQ